MSPFHWESNKSGIWYATMDRRDFLKLSTAAVVAASDTVTGAVEQAPAPATPSRVKFAVLGINHNHVQGQIAAVRRGGGELAAFHAEEPELSAEFLKRYPAVKQARSRQEILDDPSIRLIVSAAIPSDRAALAAECMRHGKDFCVDKPGATTLEQLAELRKVQADTRRIFSVLIERHESRSTQKALELVKTGALGRVIQTLATAPHKMSPATRPPWFFQRARYGGILVDLASHHADEFVAFTGSTRADVVASQIGNLNHPQSPEVEDFGDMLLRSDKATGYIRADWFTPDGLEVFGDGRTFILGTDGYIEIRKSIDIAGRPGADHVLLVDKKGAQHIDCKDQALPYGQQLVDDILDRTHTSDDQSAVFLAMEIVLRAEQQAHRLMPA